MAPQHPGWTPAHRTGVQPTVRLSDLVNLRRFWGIETYEVIHGPEGRRYPASALRLTTPRELIFLALQRRARDFSDAEIAELAEIQQLLAAAFSFRQALDRMIGQLGYHLGLAEQPSMVLANQRLLVGVDSTYAPTKRESEVLTLAAAGWTNQRIARRLGITQRTVRKHLSAVYEKSVTSGRAEATAWWQRRLHTANLADSVENEGHDLRVLPTLSIASQPARSGAVGSAVHQGVQPRRRHPQAAAGREPAL